MASSDRVRIDRADNNLLVRLPLAEWDRLRPNLQPIALEAGAVLYGRNQRLEHVYFLQRGCVSLMIDFADGFQAESGSIGHEGMVGALLTCGVKADSAAAVVQTPSVALRMPADAFIREVASLPALARLALRHGEALRGQAMQLAACNGHHGLDARLARCVLGVQDRFPANDLPVTHEALATLLCAHRPSISVVAKRLQQAGLIRYSAGHLAIADRAGLEQVACECYRVMRDHTHAMLQAS